MWKKVTLFFDKVKKYFIMTTPLQAEANRHFDKKYAFIFKDP